MPLKQLCFDEMKVIVILWCYIKLKFDVYNYYGNWSHWAKECKNWKVELKKKTNIVENNLKNVQTFVSSLLPIMDNNV